MGKPEKTQPEKVVPRWGSAEGNLPGTVRPSGTGRSREQAAPLGPRGRGGNQGSCGCAGGAPGRTGDPHQPSRRGRRPLPQLPPPSPPEASIGCPWLGVGGEGAQGRFTTSVSGRRGAGGEWNWRDEEKTRGTQTAPAHAPAHQFAPDLCCGGVRALTVAGEGGARPSATVTPLGPGHLLSSRSLRPSF